MENKSAFKCRRLATNCSVESIFSEEIISNSFIPLFCRSLIGDFYKE